MSKVYVSKKLNFDLYGVIKYGAYQNQFFLWVSHNVAVTHKAFEDIFIICISLFDLFTSTEQNPFLKTVAFKHSQNKCDDASFLQKSILEIN